MGKRKGRGPTASRGPGGKPPTEPMYAQFANWAMEHVALGIIGTLLSMAVISGGAYLLYGAKRDIAEIKSASLASLKEGLEVKRANQMTRVYTTGWNSNPANMAHLEGVFARLVASRKEADLDADWASAEIGWCTSASVALEREQALVASFLVDDDMAKKRQINLIGEYTATTKLIDAIREMIIGWKTGSRDAAVKEIERYSRDVGIALAGIEGAGEQTNDYVLAKTEKARTDYERSMDQLQEVYTKAALALAGIALATMTFVASVAVLIARGARIRWG